MGWWNAEIRTNARVDGKTAVVTGCNTGIGKETVEELVRRGCHVVMACRDVKKTEEAKKDLEKKLKNVPNIGSMVIVRLDLASMSSIRDCADVILKTESRINLLINNAGVMMCPKMTTQDGFDMQFGTNHLGHFLLTMLLLPRILKSTPARIINVSSYAHTMGTGIDFDDLQSDKNYSPINAYARSKLANVLFTRELAKKLEGTGVTTYSLHPGVVHTELTRHIDSTIFRYASVFNNYIMKFFVKSPRQGAQTTLHCALDETAGSQSGLYYAECKPTTPHPRARDEETAKKLWQYSWDLVKLESFNPFK